MSLQNTMKALDDPTRRDILNLLKKGSMTAGEIAEHFEISGAAVSKHLSVLKKADLVRTEKKGKYIIYELNSSVIEEVLLWLRSLR